MKIFNMISNKSMILRKNFTNSRTLNKIVTQSNVECLLENMDPSQVKTLDEKLILVDLNDNEVSYTSKIDAHLKSKKNSHPHRAFSVFLFNNQNELLLQKRSSKKITFPDLWSNTCCSHPLNNSIEIVKKENLGIRNAAVRRMNYELGVETEIKDYIPFQKILYRADSNEIFEEFELDYLLLARLDLSLDELKKVINTDEVSDVKYYTKEDLLKEVYQNRIQITPWFKLLVENKIDEIWDHSVNKDLKNLEELKTISYL